MRFVRNIVSQNQTLYEPIYFDSEISLNNNLWDMKQMPQILPQLHKTVNNNVSEKTIDTPLIDSSLLDTLN